MRAGAIATFLLALGVACDASQSAPADESERGAGAVGSAPVAAEAERRGDPFVAPSEERRLRVGDVQPPPAAPEPAAEASPEGAPETPRPPERDLSAELRTLAGDPSSCLASVADLPDTVAITIEATVTATGVITRSYARAPGVPEDAIECVRRRLDGARMRAPVENAPRTVTTTLELRRRTPERNEAGAAE